MAVRVVTDSGKLVVKVEEGLGEIVTVIEPDVDEEVREKSRGECFEE